MPNPSETQAHTSHPADTRLGIVYHLVNRITGHSYVGLTSRGLEHRWKGHVRAAAKNSRCRLHAAIRQYGADAFTRCTVSTHIVGPALQEAESSLIDDLGLTDPAKGYNMVAGGSLGGSPRRPILEVVEDAEMLAEGRKGRLPRLKWLQRNGYRYIANAITDYPAMFSHIACVDNIQAMTASYMSGASARRFPWQPL